MPVPKVPSTEEPLHCAICYVHRDQDRNFPDRNHTAAVPRVWGALHAHEICRSASRSSSSVSGRYSPVAARADPASHEPRGYSHSTTLLLSESIPLHELSIARGVSTRAAYFSLLQTEVYTRSGRPATRNTRDALAASSVVAQTPATGYIVYVEMYYRSREVG